MGKAPICSRGRAAYSCVRLVFSSIYCILILQNIRFAHGCMLLLYTFIITAYGANASFGAARFDVFTHFLLMFTKIKKVWHFLRKTLDICLRFGYNNTRRQGHGPRRKEYADVAELADALDSGSSSLKRVWVQIPSSAPKSSNVCSGIFCFSDLFGMTSIVPRGAGGSRFSAIDTATAPVLHWNRGCTILHQLYAMKSGRGLPSFSHW